MSYGDFTLDILRRSFGLKVRDGQLFQEIGSLAAPPWLPGLLQRNADLALGSEKARSEFIVAPVLSAVRELAKAKVHVYSGVRLDIDADRGLKGECDFILGRTTSIYVMQSPLLVVLEAKKNDIEEGLGQCAAQMLGAKTFNESDGTATPFLFGCVTTGEDWQFLKLENQELLVHPSRFGLGELERILWVLVQCIDEVDRHASAKAA